MAAAGSSLWALCEVWLVRFCTNKLSLLYEDCLPEVGGSSTSRRGGAPPPWPHDPKTLCSWALEGAQQDQHEQNAKCKRSLLRVKAVLGP